MQPPAPQLEGPKDFQKTTFLGCGADLDLPPYFEVQRVSTRKVEIKAGSFHQVTSGSLFELYAQPDHIVYARDKIAPASKSVAWLRSRRQAPSRLAGPERLLGALSFS